MHPTLRIVRLAAELAFLGLSLVSAAGAALGQIGKWIPRYDLLNHFALIWLVAGAAALVGGLLHRRGARKLITCGLALAAIAFSSERMVGTIAGPPAATKAGGCEVKLILFNSRGRASDPDIVYRWIETEDPDILVLVEPSPELARYVTAFSGLTPFHRDSLLVATRTVPLVARSGWPSTGLPGSPLAYSWLELDLAGRPISLLAVHPAWPIPARHARTRDARIAGILDRVDRRSAILAGDFNSTQWSFRHQRAEARFGLERRDIAVPTWPDVAPVGRGLRSPAPFLPIDHVYAGSLWRTSEVRLGPRLGSDHYPLVARLAWAGEGGPERPECFR
jgi:endonuclease/exonuclease/phosphatase (EEP) superfamily protein YafD